MTSKTLKVGQEIWYYDHVVHDIKVGILHSVENMSEYSENDTRAVKTKYGGIQRTLRAWIFTEKDNADKFLKEKIRQVIQQKKHDIIQLEKKL